MAVLLPAPLGPSSPVIPSYTPMSTECSATVSPYCLVNCFASRRGWEVCDPVIRSSRRFLARLRYDHGIAYHNRLKEARWFQFDLARV